MFSQKWPKNETGALIIVPSRELAYQVCTVCQPFADALEITLCVHVGKKKRKDGISDPVDLKY